MSTTKDFSYKSHSTIAKNYSDDMQRSLNSYTSILKSDKALAYYNDKFPTTDKDLNNALNPNVPITNKELKTVFVENKPVKLHEQFFNYRQPGAQLFTNFKSAGENSILENISVRDLPLKSHNDISDPKLVLSNNNLVRENMQNYGKTYLLKTNMLNAEAFNNGFAYQSASTSPYRLEDPRMLLNFSHSNFSDKYHGDIYFNSKYQLRFDLPTNYINSSITTWQYINPGFILPNKNIKSFSRDTVTNEKYYTFLTKYFDEKNLIFHLQYKYGTLMLDSLKNVGTSCLTPNFSMIPDGYSKPVDVIQDDYMYPPVVNPNYYNKNSSEYMKKEGELHKSINNILIPNENAGMYCSANNNYVVMPKNFSEHYKDTDSTFNVLPGMNSVTMGVVMSSYLKDFINKDLYEINKLVVLNRVYNDYPEIRLT